jgi:putative PIN family toxin of toxin-antitoxin system
MKDRERVVVDTNTLVSRLLVPQSVPGRAVRRVVDEAQILACEETMSELADVLAREKFDRYVTIEDRQQFLLLVGRVAEWVPIVGAVQACRDPNDDKFLALGVNGEAATIITGDDDLLVLNPFQGISIVTPADYLARDQAREADGSQGSGEPSGR